MMLCEWKCVEISCGKWMALMKTDIEGGKKWHDVESWFHRCGAFCYVVELIKISVSFKEEGVTVEVMMDEEQIWQIG